MDKSKTIDKIINQANSLNKKIKQFKSENIVDHLDFIQAMFNDKQMQYKIENGQVVSLTKSTKFYKQQNILQLQKTLATLIKINNHDVFGTVRKFKKFHSASWDTLTERVINHLLSRGYSEESVRMIVSSKDFFNKLLQNLKHKVKNIDSESVFELTYLEFMEGEIPEDQIKKAVSDIEYSIENQRKIEEELSIYDRLREEFIKRGGR